MKFAYKQRVFQFLLLEEQVLYPQKCDTLNLYSFLWIAENVLSITIDHIEYLIEGPAILCVSPNQQLKILACHKNQYLIQHNKEFYNTLYSDKEISKSGLLFHSACKNKILKVSKHQKERLQVLMEVLCEEIKKEDELREEMLRIILKCFIIISTRLAKKEVFEKYVFSNSKIDLFQKFICLVDQHFKEEHQVKFYAQQLCKAPKSLSNQFALLNLPKPLRVIHERILLEAKQLLLNTSLSFSEIAFILGFQELSQFSRFFKKNVGMSLSSFRKKD